MPRIPLHLPQETGEDYGAQLTHVGYCARGQTFMYSLGEPTPETPYDVMELASDQ